MKVATPRYNDILRWRAEYDSDTEILKKKHDDNWDRYQNAYEDLNEEVEKKVSELIGATTLDLTIGARPINGWKDTGWRIEVSLDHYSAPRALSWEWTISIDEDGNVSKDSNSWSGLDATTLAQVNELEESVRVLKILNTADWDEILHTPKVESTQFIDTDLDQRLHERKANRPDFETELLNESLESVISGNEAIELKSDQCWKSTCYIIPTSQTDRFIKGYIFPECYLTKEYTKDQIIETIGEQRRTAKKNVVIDHGEFVTTELQ